MPKPGAVGLRVLLAFQRDLLGVQSEVQKLQRELTLAKIHGGIPETLPLPRGGWCSFSPDGKQLAYNRVFREFRTWKRYRGGQSPADEEGVQRQ